MMDSIFEFALVIVLGSAVLALAAFIMALIALTRVRELERVPPQAYYAPRPAVSVPEVTPQPAAPPPAGEPPPEAVVAPEPAAAAEPQPVPEAEEPVATAAAAPAPRPDLEALLTLRWGVWLGAVALLLAGVFLVRYAAEQGMLGPGPRCVLAALPGIALFAAAEWLRRRPAPETPGLLGADQAPSALAAGGVAVLFGAAYGAGPFYQLVPPTIGFALMAIGSMTGLFASLRFGQLVAAVGIAGAFVTPLLVQTESPSLPGLFIYLLAVTAAALAVVRYTAWTWLGWASTIAGALWVLLGASLATPADAWAPALFVPAAAALNLFFLPPAALDFVVGRRLSWVPFAALGAAGLILEASVQSGTPRTGVLLLAPLAVAKGGLEPRLDRLPWLAALLFLLSLLLWALPEWHPTGEVIATQEGIIEAILPGAWAPEVIRPLLETAFVVAGFLAAAGLWRERHAPNRLRWSALPAAVPVLTLAVTYTQVARFQPDMAWAAAALVLTAALTGTAALAVREADHQRAGVHAAGAVAALALGCAMLWREHWLTVAISLLLPALAWIEARADLPPLRKVALCIAALILVRLLLNWYVVDYGFGTTPVVNGLLVAYGVPAASFAVAARMFRQRADDLTVAVLEAGAIAFITVLIALEIRHWQTRGDLSGPGTFTELTTHLATLAVQAGASLWLARKTGRPMLGWAWRIQGGIAFALACIILVVNPAFAELNAGFVALLFGYLLPAVMAAFGLRLAPSPEVRQALRAYAVLAGFAFIGLAIRDAFHPGAMGFGVSSIDDAELWAWSGAWLLYGAALMGLGIRVASHPLRIWAIAIIGLVTAKAFLVDMAGLEGLWRVLSFLGLGLVLIGLSTLYRRYVSVKH
jgi:uncharacterized membrane protein